MPAVKFYSVNTSFSLKEKTRLKHFIIYIFSAEKTELNKLNYIFCDDAYLLSLNQQFLQHDYFTDILTFNLSDSKAVVLGEIYISIDRVKENATIQKVAFIEELNRVIFHGALHLCGYLDESQVNKEVMSAKENHYLRLYNVFHVETK